MILPVASRPSYSLKAPEATSISSAEMPSGSVGRLWPSVLASIDSSTGASTRISAFSGKLTSPGISCDARANAGLGQRRGAVLGHALAVLGAGEARGDLRRDVLDVGLGVGRRHRLRRRLHPTCSTLDRHTARRPRALVKARILRQSPGCVTSGRRHRGQIEANGASFGKGCGGRVCDPVTLQIVRGALRAIQSEMEAVIERTAMSPFIREKKDFYAALFDGAGPADRRLEPARVRRRGRADRRALPARDHASRRHLLVQRLLCLQGRGLALARSGVRRARVRRRQARRPSRRAGRTSTTSAACAPGSLSPDCTDIFQEGIIVPPVRVVREGVVAEELLRLFYRNSRFPEMVKGDTRASMAAIRLGERRLAELFQRFGRARTTAAFDQLIAETERELRQKLRALVPLGEHDFTDTIDSDGQGHGPIKLRYRLEVTAERITLDTSASDDQVPGPVNFLMSPPVPAMVFGSYLLGEGSESILNDGVERALDEVVVRPGSILQPQVAGAAGHARRHHDAQHGGLPRPPQRGDRRPGHGRAQRLRDLVSARARRQGRAVPDVRRARRRLRRAPDGGRQRCGLSGGAGELPLRVPRLGVSRCACRATPSIPIPAGRAAGAAAAASSASWRCWRRKPWSPCASTASSIRPGASPAATLPGRGAASSTPAGPTSASCGRSATAISSSAATSCASRPAAAAAGAIRSTASRSAWRPTCAADSSAGRARRSTTAWCWPPTGCPSTGGDGQAPRAPAGGQALPPPRLPRRARMMAAAPKHHGPRVIVGVDTGGTFTDVTLLDPATGRVWTAKTPVDAGRPLARLRQRHRRGAEGGGPRGRRRRPRPARHHGCDQPDPRGQGRARRAAHHRRLQVRAGDRPAGRPAPRQPVRLGEAEAPGAARAHLRDRRAHRPRRPRAAAARRGGGARRRAGDRGSRASARSPSCCCTATPTRRTSGASPTSSPRRCRARWSRCRARCCRCSANTSAA